MHIIFLVTAGACHGLSDLCLHRFHVTGPALQSLMRALQLEVGPGVVVKGPQVPTIGVVAGSAFGTEAPFVVIMRLVATEAVRGGLFVGGLQMAFLAGSDSMKSDQGETRQIVVKEDLHAPAPLIVTALTLFSFLALMHIVRLVAVVTIHWQFFFLTGSPVTGIASDFAMLVFERKLGFVVIINRMFPLLWRVAGLALLSVAALVLIIILVTGEAGGVQFLLCEYSRMTGIAGNLLVLPFEGKFCFVVIVNRVVPVGRRLLGSRT